MKYPVVRMLRKIGNWVAAYCHTRLVQSLLRRSFRHARGMIEIDDFDGNLKIELSLSEHMQRRTFWMGYYNRDIILLLKAVLKKNMTVIDIGANIGEITLVSAKLTGSEGRVIAFEPIDRIADRLQSHIDRNRYTQVTVVRAGLSDKNGSAPIYTSHDHDQETDENEGLGSLYAANTREKILQNIQLTTLDSFLDLNENIHPDIIKIDIEGAELPCLRGARKTIEKFSPLIIIEVQKYSASIAGYSQEDILDYLASLGYAYNRIGNNGKLMPLTRNQLGEYQNVFCFPAKSQYAATERGSP